MITHSWYTAFAPFNATDPDDIITVTAIVEYGGAGSVAAAPIVSEVMEAYFSGSDLDTARRNIWRKRASKYRKPADTPDTSGVGGGDSEESGGAESEGRGEAAPEGSGGGDSAESGGAESEGGGEAAPEGSGGGDSEVNSGTASEGSIGASSQSSIDTDQ